MHDLGFASMVFFLLLLLVLIKIIYGVGIEKLFVWILFNSVWALCYSLETLYGMAD
jgi:hypothetical protein